MYTGDELSRRAKFALVTWIGGEVGALKRAKVSIDKALVKDVITVSFIFIFFFFIFGFFVQNFAVELATSDLADLEEERIKELLIKAGGANYGNGTAKNV